MSDKTAIVETRTATHVRWTTLDDRGWYSEFPLDWYAGPVWFRRWRASRAAKAELSEIIANDGVLG